MMPHDLPPWYLVSQQTQRWLEANCLEAMVDDLRLLLRGVKGRKGQPSAAIFPRDAQPGASFALLDKGRRAMPYYTQNCDSEEFSTIMTNTYQ